MSGVSVNIGATSNVKAGLKRAMEELREWRAGVRRHNQEAQREAGQGGGLFGVGALTKANLYAMAIAKVGAALTQVVTDAGELQDAADELGISAGEISKLQRAMEGAGVDVAEARKALRSLNGEMQNAKEGNAAALEKFAKFGIAGSELKKMRLDEVLFRVADGMKAMGDDGGSAVAAVDLLGSKNAKMIATMRAGSEELKKTMSDTAGALKNESVKEIDDLSDMAGSAWSAVKGFAGNAIAGVSTRIKGAGAEALKELKEIADQPGVVRVKQPGDDEWAAKQAEQAKKAAATAEAQNKKDEADRLKRMGQARKEITDKTEAARVDDIKTEAAKDLTAAQAEANKRATEFLTLNERTALLVRQMAQSKAAENSGGDDVKDKEKARQAQIQNDLDAVREKKIERNGMSARARSKAIKAERDAIKAREKGARVTAAKERDRIDRAFRDGRLTRAQRDQMMLNLRAGKKGEQAKSPEQAILEDIRGVMKALGDKIRVGI